MRVLLCLCGFPAEAGNILDQKGFLYRMPCRRDGPRILLVPSLGQLQKIDRPGEIRGGPHLLVQIGRNVSHHHFERGGDLYHWMFE